MVLTPLLCKPYPRHVVIAVAMLKTNGQTVKKDIYIFVCKIKFIVCNPLKPHSLATFMTLTLFPQTVFPQRVLKVGEQWIIVHATSLTKLSEFFP